MAARLPGGLRDGPQFRRHEPGAQPLCPASVLLGPRYGGQAGNPAPLVLRGEPRSQSDA